MQRLMGFLPIPSPCARGVIKCNLEGMAINCVKNGGHFQFLQLKSFPMVFLEAICFL